jgi:leader peptidase (prepilin peptidase) / N-methyltransferase
LAACSIAAAYAVATTLDPYLIFAAASFLFGLCFGSFLNVCIYRLPRGLSVVSPRSACPQCHTPIAAYDNIPVLSWFILRGRCRQCKTRITPRYAIVELITGLLFLAVFLHYGLDLATLKYFVFSFLILGLIFTDAETRLLPDKLTLPGFALGLIFSIFVPVNGLLNRFAPDLFPEMPDVGWRIVSFGNALIGALLAAGFIFLAGELYFRLRGQEGMGLGDSKLMLLIGAFLGAKFAILTIFLACVTGSLYGLSIFPAIYRRRQNAPSMLRRFPDPALRKREAYHSAMHGLRIPFGVFLGGMSFVSLFLGDNMLNRYLGLFR